MNHVTSRDCPTDDLLEAVLSGATSLEQIEAVAAHVRDCSGCLEKLHALHERTSPLVARLRQAAEPPLLDTALEQAVDRVKQTVCRESRLAVPGELDEYRLLERLGEGGMGQVYRATHTRLGKTVAVKVLAASRLYEHQAVARFEREMKAVGALSHPNVVAAYDAAEADGRHYLVMEFVPGMDLARLVKEGGPLPVAVACEVARQAAEGLAYAHGQGLVHRDVKPSNLILTPEGQVKILDLGLALLKGEPAVEQPAGPDEGPSSTLTGARMLTSVSRVMGTNDYMAPEQWQDSHAVGAQADQYSLGCTLYHLLTGRPPFDGPGQLSLLAKCEAHRLQVPPSLRALRPDVPARLERVVLRLLAKAPEERYPDAQAVAEALRPFASKRDLPGLLRGAGKGDRSAPKRRRSGLAMLLVVGLGLAGLSVAPFLARPPEKREIAAPPAGGIPMSTDEALALQRQWAEHLDQPVSERNVVGMDMVLVPPGSFDVQSDLTVHLTRPYRLGRTEVTLGQFRAFVTATGYRTEAEASGLGGHLLVRAPGPLPTRRDPRWTWHEPGYPDVSDEHPVTQVAWVDAEAFCRWLGAREGRTYRLPTEAECKWACRAGTKAAYVLGNELDDLHRHAWVGRNAGRQPMPVGRRAANAWGLHDMMGNVSEWVLDWYASVSPRGEVTDPAGPASGTAKVVHGPCYWFAEQSWRARGLYDPWFAGGHCGFRVLREVGPSAGPRPLDRVRPPVRPKDAGKAVPP